MLVCSAVAGVACQEVPEHRVEVMQGDCWTCHAAEYEATTSPPHHGVFPLTCGDCHTNTEWIPAVGIRHDWFPLQNRHAEIACADCHSVGFAPGNTPNECVGCHRADYDAATMPTHDGYSTDCASCHTDAGWRPATFDHSWPLTGAHAMTACASCHTGDPPLYEGTPTQCVGCHQDDYDTSPYPGHSTFPTTCTDCHTTTAWSPAMGEGAHPESAFPIATGRHDMPCADCHDPALGSAVDGMNTDCVGCHSGEHARARMDDVHQGEGGYPTGAAPPNFCLDCHSDGRN